jgi:hypothetical protein
MNRRNILKGMVALPFIAKTAAYAKLCGGGTCPSTGSNKPLQIVFDGPFSLVLHTVSNSSDVVIPNGVMAFTPVEPHGKHLLNLNGVPLDEKKDHHFTLNIGGFTPPNQPCISSDFDDFCTDHTGFTLAPQNSTAGEIFVSITLPCPNRIVTASGSQPIPVTVGGSSKKMPQNHILEYDVADLSKVTMSYRESGRNAAPFGNLFLFEVGMDPTQNPDSDCSHLKQFYNQEILPFFPALAGNTIDVPAGTCPMFTPRLYFAPPLSRDDRKYHPFTTTLECKAGGLIATTSP